MLSNLQQFFITNASAVFALMGAIAGGFLSFLASLLLKRHEFNLQIRSKLLDKQIAAHETILMLAGEMRAMYASGGLGTDGEVVRVPQILLSKKEFEVWFTRFSELQMQGTSWLSNTAKREVGFVQDYLVTLHTHLVEIPDSNLFVLGQAVRDDFIDLSASLEKRAFEFFLRDIKKLKPDSLEIWHKYERRETERRFSNMKLLKVIEKFKVSPNKNH